MPSFPFVTVDVFTDVRFGGNPLAVITEAQGLTSAQMQQIAREFNYAESTFVFPPSDPANTAQVRIFTPTTEVPFAGHPNVGTAFVLGCAGKVYGKPIGTELRFEEIAGLVKIQLDGVGAATTSALITAPAPLTIKDGIGVSDVADCVSLASDDFVVGNHPPVRASVGLELLVSELRDLDALARARPNTDAFVRADKLLPTQLGGLATFLYVVVSTDPMVIRARMFAPLDNIPEDPATGSAAGALGGLLTSLRQESDLDLHITVNQGVEMGRPSTIELDVTKRAGVVTKVVIGGQSVPVLSGTITI